MEPTKSLVSTAYHQAGHAVAAYKFNLKPKDLTIIDEGNGDVEYIPAPYISEDNMKEYEAGKLTAVTKLKLENDAFISLAGPLAQIKFDPWGFKHSYAERDYHQAIDLLSMIEQDNEVLELYFDLIDLRARKFLSRRTNWKTVDHLAKAALEQPKMSGRTVQHAISEGYDIC